MHPVYNSRSPLCRAPVGAVPSGTVVRFRVYPESYRFPVRGYIVLWTDGRTPRSVRMTHHGRFEDREVFEVDIPTEDYAGIVFYFFRFENEGGSFCYGARIGRTGGEAEFSASFSPNPYQLTVYSPASAAAAPEWFGDGVSYQIFPDRFARSGAPLSPDDVLADGTSMSSRQRIARAWGDDPDPSPELFDGRMQVTNRDFFGGNLAGITEKLDYLASLGVTTIYMNPIFEAFSNHRYDTADYEHVDPLLGTEETLGTLCREAHARGMRVLLDGVFNHTGSDSRYFNRLGRYGDGGAFQSKESPYYKWYHFTKWPRSYESWWGMDSLPAVNENDPGYREYIAGENGIIRRWLRAGADGWRLDVADELPDSFIAEIKRAALAEKPDAFVIGEVWEDASSKISYSVRRKYILGVDGSPALDAVMGYVFRTAALRYRKGGSAADFRDEMEDLRENYPPYATHNSMNILGTHDTPRILTLLGTPDEVWEGPKETRAKLVCAPEDRPRAVRLLKVAAALQFCYPGSPTVYYGDEAGIEGSEDPYSRRTFPWGKEDGGILAHYRLLGDARRRYEALRRGSIEYLAADGGLLAFRREVKDDPAVPPVIFASNVSDEMLPLNLEAGSVWRDLLTGSIFSEAFVIPPRTARILVPEAKL